MLEQMLYGGWTDEDDPPRPANLDSWFMDQVMNHAVRLWRGGQVDGSVWEWESEFYAGQSSGVEIVGSPNPKCL